MAEHTSHPTVAQYWKIAVVLAFLTGIEVSLFYIDAALGLGGLNALLLIILAILKFVIVVGWYMHLRYEKPILNRFFTAGIAVAMGCYVVVLATLGVVVIRGA